MSHDLRAFDQVPKQDLLRRIDGLRSLMGEEHIDFALVFENVDKFYFSGTMQKGILVIPMHEEPLLFIEKGTERARSETPFTITPVNSHREIRAILKDKGVLKGRGGLELDVVPVALFERLKRSIGFDHYANIGPLIQELRMIKSDFELEQMKRSGQMLAEVFAIARNVIREGVTELDIDAALVAEGRKLGHQGLIRMRGINQEMTVTTVQTGYTGTITTFVDGPITGAGITPAVPYGSSFNKVEKGIPVTVDYGATHNGYITDETRTFVVGRLKEMFRKPYETALEIIGDVTNFAREGVDCTEIFSRAYSIVQKAHLQDYFMGCGEGQVSFIGHGVGLEVNELPVITARHGRVLRAGMVFALEPKFVLPPYGAIGIEVDLIVRPDSVERVTGDSIDIGIIDPA
jgi:Xaa-Pro dipeptidase